MSDNSRGDNILQFPGNREDVYEEACAVPGEQGGGVFHQSSDMNLAPYCDAVMYSSSITDLLGTIAKCDIDRVIIIGIDDDGEEHIMTTLSNGGEIMWLLEHTKIRILNGIQDFIRGD